MKLCVKSFTTGILAAALGVAAVGTALAEGGIGSLAIKSANFNANKVVFDGKTLDLSKSPMLSVVKEGETDASNYMPLRGVLEEMGYKVDWNGQTQTVTVTSQKTDESDADKSSGQDETMAGMPNPWEVCSEDESFKYLGAKFLINPPSGFELEEIAVLGEQYAGETGKTARYAYLNDNGDMYRVHITEETDAADELQDQGHAMMVDGLEVYYSKEGNSITYAQYGYSVVIDIIGDTNVWETVGSVKMVN